MRFAYFYLMGDDRLLIARLAPRHATYWDELRLPGYLGGPFADRSGGLILFEAENPTDAGQLVAGDPFLRRGAVATWWLEPWLPTHVGTPTTAAGAP